MILQNKKIIIWSNPELSQGLSIDDVVQFLKTRFEVIVTESFAELMALCQQQPIGVILVDSLLQSSSETLEHLMLKFPELLRFSLSRGVSTSDITDLYEKCLIHKNIQITENKDFLNLQLQETCAFIHIVSEKNKFLELSITDPITQLTNHRFFQQKFRQELHKAKINKEPLSLIMIDVDHFKLLNDQFGHPKGDSILAIIAQNIKNYLPLTASASRYGGEEFAIVLPKSTSKKALATAEDIRIGITKISKIDFRLSISLGVASFPEHGRDADEILSLADQALYCAKRQGRNMTVVAGDSSY